MARTKSLNLVVHYGGTNLYVNDRGSGKSPRFELWDDKNKQVIAKADNPVELDNAFWKIWKKN